MNETAALLDAIQARETGLQSSTNAAQHLRNQRNLRLKTISELRYPVCGRLRQIRQHSPSGILPPKRGQIERDVLRRK